MAKKRIHGGYLGREQYQKQLDEAAKSAGSKQSAPATSDSQPSENYWDKVSEAFKNINVPDSVKKIFGK